MKKEKWLRPGKIDGYLILALLLTGLLYGQSKKDPPKKGKTKKVSSRKMNEKELRQLLVRLEKKLGKVKSLYTTYTQEKHLTIFRDVVKSKGVLLFQNPDKIRFQIQSPFRSVMITNQKKVAKYEYLEGKWQKLKLGNPNLILAVTAQIATWHRGVFRMEKGIYHISGLIGHQSTLVLTPKAKALRQRIKSINITLSKDEKAIQKVVILEKGSDYTVIRFTKEKKNITLSPQLFDTDRSAPYPIPKDG